MLAHEKKWRCRAKSLEDLDGYSSLFTQGRILFHEIALNLPVLAGTRILANIA